MKEPEEEFSLIYNDRNFKLLITPDYLILMEELISSFDESQKTDIIINRKDIRAIKYQSGPYNQMGYNHKNEIVWIETDKDRWEFIEVYPSAMRVALLIEPIKIILP